jgi:hypothetical protein
VQDGQVIENTASGFGDHADMFGLDAPDGFPVPNATGCDRASQLTPLAPIR